MKIWQANYTLWIYYRANLWGLYGEGASNIATKTNQQKKKTWRASWKKETFFCLHLEYQSHAIVFVLYNRWCVLTVWILEWNAIHQHHRKSCLHCMHIFATKQKREENSPEKWRKREQTPCCYGLNSCRFHPHVVLAHWIAFLSG